MRAILLLAILLGSPLWAATTSSYTFSGVGAGPVVTFVANQPVQTGSLRSAGGLAVTKNLVTGQGHAIGVASTATAAGTTVLTTASAECQVFTGSTTQTITLPAANGFGAGVGQIIFIKNRSSGALTVNRAGSDTIDGTTTQNVSAGSALRLISNGVSDWTIN